MNFIRLTSTVIFFFLASLAFAKMSQPSFDCLKANSPAEIAICSNDELASLDKKVADAFVELKTHPEGRIKGSVEDLIKDQKKWLHTRDHDYQSSDVEWLKTTYKTRLMQLTFPGAPTDLSEQNIKDLEIYFAANGCEAFASLDKFDLEMNDGLEKFGLKLYEINPKLAKKLFTYQSRCDWYPSIDLSKTDLNKVPALSEYIDHLDQLRARTRDRDGFNPRLEAEDVMLALHDCDCSLSEEKDNVDLVPYPDYKKMTQIESDFYKLPYYNYPALLHYSWQGLWEQDQYKKHLKLREAARKNLINYYIQNKHIPLQKAEQAAWYHVMNISDTYIGSHYTHEDKLGLTDLDNYLQTGILPKTKSPKSQYTNDYVADLYNYNYQLATERARFREIDILTYFLRLAIVNNYSKEDISKILNAGAAVTGTALADEALMNSVRRPEILELLLNKGANVSAQNSFGKTPLMYAIQFGNLSSVKILLDHHANINAKTSLQTSDDIKAGKRTPLMYAAWHANNEVVQYLLAHGADPTTKDTEGHDYKFYLQQNDYGQA